MRGGITEDVVEEAALEHFRARYHTLSGPAIAADGVVPERASYEQVVLTDRLRRVALSINPTVAESVIDQAIVRLQRAKSQNTLAENEHVHRLIVEGVPVEPAVPTDRSAPRWSR